MKFPLAIVSILLASALALPVPDEDVSVVKPVTEVKSEVVHPEDGKHVHHVVKNELRSAVEADSQYQGKVGEQAKTVSLPAGTAANAVSAAGVASSPNAVNAVVPEVQAPAQVLAEQKEKKTELKKEEPQRKAAVADAQSQSEYNKVEQTDKQTRSDGVVDGAKNLPVAGVHVSALGEQKQFVDEVKPSVQENHVEGKSSLPLAGAQVQEPAKTELSAQGQSKTELKPDSAAPATTATSFGTASGAGAGAGVGPAAAAAAAAAPEEKREEVPARQERVAEEKHQQQESVAPVVPLVSFSAVPTVAPSAVYTEVKSLVAEEPKAQESKPEVQTVTAEGKSLTGVKHVQKPEKHLHEHKEVKQEHESVETSHQVVSSPAKKFDNTPEAVSHVVAPVVPVEKVGTGTGEHKFEHQSLKKLEDSSSSSSAAATTEEDKSNELKKTEASKESKESTEDSAESSEQKKHN